MTHDRKGTYLMARTTEQVAADDALTAAIEQCAVAYFGADGRVLTEYVVVGAWQGWDDDGDSETAIATLHRDSSVAHHRLLGLVEYAAARFRKNITED